MDVTVTARHTSVSDRFRRHLEEKVEKVEQLCNGCYRVDAVVSEEKNPRQTSLSHRIELTVHSRGPVVRGEACASDPYAALDLALDKLYERLRRARDRRKVHHGRHAPESLTQASARWEGVDVEAPRAAAAPVDGPEVHVGLNGSSAPAATGEDAGGPRGALDGSPVEIREKIHPAVPMTVEQALYEMELVGPRLLPLRGRGHRGAQRHVPPQGVELRRDPPGRRGHRARAVPEPEMAGAAQG